MFYALPSPHPRRAGPLQPLVPILLRHCEPTLIERPRRHPPQQPLRPLIGRLSLRSPTPRARAPGARGERAQTPPSPPLARAAAAAAPPHPSPPAAKRSCDNYLPSKTRNAPSALPSDTDSSALLASQPPPHIDS